MADVTFNDDTEVAPRRTVPSRRMSLFARVVIALGLAKDPEGAQVVLLVFALICFVGAILVQLWLSQTYVTPKPIPSAITQTHK